MSVCWGGGFEDTFLNKNGPEIKTSDVVAIRPEQNDVLISIPFLLEKDGVYLLKIMRCM